MIGIEPNEVADCPHALPDSSGLFHLITNHEGLWWPYLSMCRALFQMQRDRALVLAIHGQMAAEATAVLRLERDMVLQLSSKVLDLTKNHGCDYSMRLNGVFNDAIACVRELGEAVIDMQVRALTSMRNNSEGLSDDEVQPVIASRTASLKNLQTDAHIFSLPLTGRALGNQSPNGEEDNTAANEENTAANKANRGSVRNGESPVL